jgi:predicted membrane GTPase involved in stress response
VNPVRAPKALTHMCTQGKEEKINLALLKTMTVEELGGCISLHEMIEVIPTSVLLRKAECCSQEAARARQATGRRQLMKVVVCNGLHLGKDDAIM